MRYMAPELLKGQKYDNKVDIWDLRYIIYEIYILGQCFDFNDNNLIIIVNKINNGEHGKINLNKYSSDWQDLIDSILQIDPKKRPNIEDFYDKINEMKDKIPKISKMNDISNTNNPWILYHCKNSWSS